MVNPNFIAVANELNQNDKVLFFAILKMDNLTDRWSLVFSGANLKDLERKKELFQEIVSTLNSKLSGEAMQDVARIGIFPLTNHLISDIRKKHRENSDLKNERANGNFIHEGHVFINRKKNTNMRLV